MYKIYIYLTSEYLIENTAVENCIRLLFVLYHECAHVYHWRAKGRYNSISTYEAHITKKRGATCEHHAHKFALWHLIMDDIPIEAISSALSSWYSKLGATRTEYRVSYSYCVILRYCRWLAYLNAKYGKLCIPPDLGYIFVNRETGKLYKPNAEIKSIVKTSDN